MKSLRYSIKLDVEDQVARIALLPQLPVHIGAQAKVARVGHVCRIDQPGTEHRTAVAVLHAQVRAVVILEVVANRVVVGDAVACYVVHR